MQTSVPTASLRLIFLVALFACSLLIVFAALAEDDGGYVGDNPNITTGPDVTVWSISDTRNWGTDGGYRAYSVSSDSCNIGSENLNWCDESLGCAGGATQADHPIIAQNLYRLKDGRFRQLGKSWVKHGFFAVNTPNGTVCTGNVAGAATPCVSPFGGGDSLIVGCTDLYTATTNGSRSNLGPRTDANPTTGVIPASDSQSGTLETLGQRIQVQETDLVDDADGYWVEIHYVGADDAQYVASGETIATNGLNNASYSPVTLGAAPSRNLTFPGDPSLITQREAAAIWAWKAADPLVDIANTDVVSTGSNILERFHVAKKVTANTTRGTPAWHYEVVVHNMNSDRQANALRVQFPPNTTFANVGFQDVDWHSGEETNQSNLDWANVTNEPAGTLRWASVAEGGLEDNAIPWSTSFNFWFDSDGVPNTGVWTIELFKPGTPTEIAIPFGGIFSDGFESGDTGAWAP